MDSVHQVLSEIRDLINSALKQPELLDDRKNWHRLCSSLDNITDSQSAIEKYKYLEDFEGHDGYLMIYGLFHSLFLQQNTIRTLAEALIHKKINFRKEYPKLYEIREVRNDSVGHPTDRRGGKYFVVIVQHTIRKWGFQYIVYDEEDYPNYQNVNIKKILQTQEELVIEILTKIHSKIEHEVDMHKEKFEGEKLADLIPETMNYYFEKLYEGCHSSSTPIEYVKIHIDHIGEIFEKVLSGIEKRFKSIDAIMGLEHRIKKVRFILNRLSELADQNKYSEGFEAEALIDSLKHELSDFKKLVKDIDQEFEK